MLNIACVMFGERAWGDVVFGGLSAILSVWAVVRTWHYRDTSVSIVDCICLVFSVIGLVVWAYFRQSDLGVVCAICADIIAFFPVIGRILKKPETQPVATYFIGFSAAAVALAADGWQGPIGINSAFTVYLMVIDILLPLATLGMRAIYRNRHQPRLEEAIQLKV